MFTATKHANRLINEKSPYLLQHAHNPVDWYPWGNEAFEKAKREDKPVFLSIGYSTCHWCHVMAHESFEDEEAAQVLNRDFIAIKVDKEERPDVDAVYMAVCQALTGQGGWPMTILMTPDKKPFLAGTYFPKKSRYGMPGLLDLLYEVSRKWKTEKESLLASGEKIAALLSQEAVQRQAEVSKETVEQAVRVFVRSFDEQGGGFGSSPKFPTSHNLMFLLRYAEQETDEHALHMVETTLRQMYRGGIFDHIGGGFSRYSTDDKWLVPHFEKMLYDNALLTMAYAQAYQVTKKPLYKRVAMRVLDYVSAEMTNSGGGFYSAQDADSDGVEGKYYVFTPREVIRVLGMEDGQEFNRFFSITHHGNFEGGSIPNLLGNPDFEPKNEKMEQLCQKMYAYRKDRTTLHRDDKILTSWNALMIAAFCMAGRIFGEEKYLQAAQKAMQFLEENLKDGEKLRVYYRDGESRGTGSLDDYAFMVWAYLELYRATFDVPWLEKAVRLNKSQIEDFFDAENGGCYIYGAGGEQLIARPKEIYDGAIPSGNSVTANNLLLLAALTADSGLDALAQKQVGFIAGQVSEYPAGYSFSLMAFIQALYPAREIVCVLPDAEEIPAVQSVLNAVFLPQTTVLVKTEQNSEALAQVAPFTKEYDLQEQGTSCFYICQGSTCSAAFSGLDRLKNRL